jgi:hypothetical protein
MKMRKTTAGRWVLGAAAVALLLFAAGSASAQMREFTGRIEQVDFSGITVRNRTGDRLTFVPAASVLVQGAKERWGELKRNDRVSVSWKMMDEPRIAYAVVVLSPRGQE